MSGTPPKHSSPSPCSPLLNVEEVYWRVRNKDILTALNLTVNQGDWVAIVGPNGAGKSSLLRCCLGWSPPTQGAVRVHGVRVQDYTPKVRAAKMAWLPQHTRLAEPMSVRHVVANARYRFSESRDATLKAVDDALTRMHVSNLSERCWTTLSGGEQQRVNLAALVAQDADLWFLDEPANHLDPAVQRSVFEQLTQQWSEGQTLVMVTHDLNLLLSTVPTTQHNRVRVMGMAQGRPQFLESLNAEALPKHLESLYDISIEETTAFGHRHWVFGAHS